MWKKRAKRLADLPPSRVGRVLPMVLPPPREDEEIDYRALGNGLLSAAWELHQNHHEVCPKTAKTASIGLIRFANIGPLVEVARALLTHAAVPDDVKIHLCCYHARQLLLLRNALETRLDRILKRGQDTSIFDHVEISREVLNSDARHHVFIVMATPVAEVGRDHDYDWAVVEPSSMRSIIQLAGRVWRHRPEKTATCPNILIMDSNIKALKHGENLGSGKAVFTRPGFEQMPSTGSNRKNAPRLLLASHKLSELATSDQLNSIDSTPRIVKPQTVLSTERLADLEHAAMESLMNNDAPFHFVSDFWRSDGPHRANGFLQLLSPFRLQERQQTEFVCLPDEEQENGFSFTYADAAWENLQQTKNQNKSIRFTKWADLTGGQVGANPGLTPWLVMDLGSTLTDLAARLGEGNLQRVALQYANVSMEDDCVWHFHPWLGFWQG